MPSSPPSEIGLIRYDDTVQPFMLHRSSVRGRMVRLGESLNHILTRHDMPVALQRLLAELLTLGAMLSSNLPEKGILTMQAKGSGPVRFMVVDAVHGGALRGYADMAEGGAAALEALGKQETPALAALLGTGYLAITLDMGFGDPYQGIVPLEGACLAEAVQHYFTQSQQIDVLFKMAIGRRVDAQGQGKWMAGGIMLERMPEEGGHPLESKPMFGQDGRSIGHVGSSGFDKALQGWDYNALLVDTATEDELLDPYLAPSALLYHLFNEGGVWVHDTKRVSAECRCSRRKIRAMLHSMGEAAIEEMKVDGMIEVTCQFCNTAERFTDGDLAPEAEDSAPGGEQRSSGE